jgi:site-specific recombinase XerD
MKLPPEVLTTAEVESLMEAAGPSRTGARNRALIVLLWRGGLRLAEALSLQPKDVDAETGRVRILRGKGQRTRTTVLDPGAVAVVREWMAEREKLSTRPLSPIVCTLAGRTVSQSYVRSMLRRLAKQAGVTKRVHAHGLRHTFAHELASEGAPVHYVRDLLGHTSLGTTDTYLRALGAGPAVEWAAGRDPISVGSTKKGG